MRTTLACLVALASSPASAQGWEFAGSLYAWLPGMATSVDTPEGRVDGDLSGADALSALDMAFMGTLEARHGRLGFIGDLLYADLSGSQDTPFRLFDEARVETKLTAFSGYVTYRVHDAESLAVDLGGGFRAFGIELDTALTSDLAPRQEFDASTSWAVPLVVGRVVAPIGDNWFATAFADVGGLSSDDTTWQAFASVGYRFNDTWTTQLGYRYMDLKKVVSGEDASIALYGPLIGVTAHF